MAGRPTRHVPRDSSRRRIWVYLAVAAFVLVDILLIALALGSTHADADATASRPVATFAATPAPTTPVATPEPTTAGARATPTVGVPPTRILAAFDAKTAWRAKTGPCPAVAAAPELTTDAGKTWKPTDATTTTKITAIQRIKVSGPRVASMVGLNQTDCAPQFVKTYVGGDTFKSYPTEVDGSWYVDPSDRATVHSPSGDAKAPCAEVIALAPRDNNAAAVLCADHALFITTDAAEKWSEPVSVAGAVNLTVARTGYIVVAAGLPECAGVQVLALTAKPLKASSTGCLPMDVSPKTLPGTVAVSEAAGTLWLWAGNVFKRSSDGGTTWQ